MTGCRQENLAKLSVIFVFLSVVQAFLLPTLFCWQLPLGLMAFYASLLLLGFLRSMLSRVSVLILILSVLLWIVPNITESEKIQSKSDNKIDFYEDAVFKVSFDRKTFNFLLNEQKGKILVDPIYSLKQKSGRVAYVKLSDRTGTETSYAVAELQGLFSKAGWIDQRLLLRRLAAIIRQDRGRVQVVLSGQGPFYLAVAKTFAFQARLETIRSGSPIGIVLGVPGDLILTRGLSQVPAQRPSTDY